jgi:SAM-dependent methyltransferase
MFPIDFPLEQLRLYPATSRVLDPFCGRGTTIYAARLAGVPAVGVDVNPVAVAIARAKLAKASLTSVVGLAQALLSEAAGEVPQGEFWRWFYALTGIFTCGRASGWLTRRFVPASGEPGFPAEVPALPFPVNRPWCFTWR